MPRWSVSLVLSGLFLTVSASSSAADTIRVNFDVTVRITEGALEDIFGVPVSTGDVVRGSFTIDSKAVDTNPGNPDFGRYLTTGNFLRIGLGTGLTLPISNWQVSDATSSCLPSPVCVDTLNTGALSHGFPGFALVGAVVFLSAPPASRQGDQLPQKPADLAVYTLGNFVFEGQRVNLPRVTEEMSGPLRVRDVSTDPMPEPTTLLLVGTGAAGLASRRRRTRTGGN
jgi:hypothetical protein